MVEHLEEKNGLITAKFAKLRKFLHNMWIFEKILIYFPKIPKTPITRSVYVPNYLPKASRYINRKSQKYLGTE